MSDIICIFTEKELPQEILSKKFNWHCVVDGPTNRISMDGFDEWEAENSSRFSSKAELFEEYCRMAPTYQDHDGHVLTLYFCDLFSKYNELEGYFYEVSCSDGCFLYGEPQSPISQEEKEESAKREKGFKALDPEGYKDFLALEKRAAQKKDELHLHINQMTWVHDRVVEMFELEYKVKMFYGDLSGDKYYGKFQHYKVLKIEDLKKDDTFLKLHTLYTIEK